MEMHGHEFVDDVRDIQWVIDNDPGAIFQYEHRGHLRFVKSLPRNLRNLVEREEIVSVSFSSSAKLAAFQNRRAPLAPAAPIQNVMDQLRAYRISHSRRRRR